jgi:hypothetical protein
LPDRRRFLQLSALGVLAAVADSACAPGERGTALDHPALVEVLGEERVREIGTHYRAATPGERSADALRAAISSGRGFHLPFFGNGSLAGVIKDDFANGRTVLVDGWVLSVTEARQAALFSLTPA